jgi:tight adherence protein B
MTSGPPPAVTLAAIGLAGAALLRRHRARQHVRARLEVPPARPAAAPGTPRGTRVAVAATGLATTWLAAGPAAAVALVAGAGLWFVRTRRRRQSARRDRRRTMLPVALDQLAASLRTGASLTMALTEVGDAMAPPLGPELTRLGGEAARGRPVTDVLDGWSAAHDDTGTRLAATALVLATVVGSAPARAVDGVAATVRERLDLAGERRALATQARTSSMVLSLAPIGFAALLLVADTAAARFLLGTPAGWGCLAAGTGLDAAGAWWMARLSRSDDW